MKKKLLSIVLVLVLGLISSFFYFEIFQLLLDINSKAHRSSSFRWFMRVEVKKPHKKYKRYKNHMGSIKGIKNIKTTWEV